MQFLETLYVDLDTVPNCVLSPIFILKMWQMANLFATFVANEKLLLDFAALDPLKC